MAETRVKFLKAVPRLKLCATLGEERMGCYAANDAGGQRSWGLRKWKMKNDPQDFQLGQTSKHGGH